MRRIEPLSSRYRSRYRQGPTKGAAVASSVIGEFPSVARTLPRIASDVQLSDALRDAVAKGLPPLTIVRAPRGYGKTALISAWLEADLPVEAVHYLSLSKRCREEDSFWAELTAAVFDDPELGPEGIMAALAADEKKRLIIIDNFHLAGADGNVRELDEHLIEIVRRFRSEERRVGKEWWWWLVR